LTSGERRHGTWDSQWLESAGEPGGITPSFVNWSAVFKWLTGDDE